MGLTVAVLAWLLVAPAADAGTYTVWSCRGPAGEPLSASAWVPRSVDAEAGDVRFDDTCASGGAFSVALAEGRSFDASVVGLAAFAAPPGTRIGGYELWRSLNVAPPELLGLFEFGAAVAESVGGTSTPFGCTSALGDCHALGNPADPLAAGNRVTATATPLDAVQLQVTCRWSQCARPNGTAAIVRLYQSRVEIEDPTPPDAARLSGDPTAGAIVVSSADAGAGIASMALSVDGGEATSATLCTPPFTSAPPCPTVAAHGFSVPRLPAGTHTLSGTVTDAAGNVRAWGPVEFLVGGVPQQDVPPAATPPPGSGSGDPPVSIASVDEPKPRIRLAKTTVTRDVGERTRVTGTLRTPAGTPIAGARLTVRSLALGVDRAQPRALAAPVTDSRGRFTVVVRRDGAQRVTIGYAGASAVATVRTRLRLHVTPSRGHLTKGRVLTLRGRLAGAGESARGVPVRIESIVNGRWLPVGAAKIRADGTFTWRYRFVHLVRDTRFSFRAVVAGTPGWPWPTVRSARRLVDVDVP